MTTYEWVTLITVIVGGFWVLSQKLSRIEVAMASKVGFKECSEKRDKCPCVKELEQIKERIEK